MRVRLAFNLVLVVSLVGCGGGGSSTASFKTKIQPKYDAFVASVNGVGPVTKTPTGKLRDQLADVANKADDLASALDGPPGAVSALATTAQTDLRSASKATRVATGCFDTALPSGDVSMITGQCTRNSNDAVVAINGAKASLESLTRQL